MSSTIDTSKIEAKIQSLSSHAWDSEVAWPRIQAWLNNFDGACLSSEEEKAHALYSLTKYMYFSKRLVREMLKSLYRDHFESPVKQRIRRNFKGTLDFGLIDFLFQQELNATRFIGVGNPSESGAHLLYYFRQVNGLSKDLFCDFHEAFYPSRTSTAASGRLDTIYLPRRSGVKRYVFFDDLVGSGTQVKTYMSRDLKGIRTHVPGVDIKFISMFATSAGLKTLNGPDLFDGQATTLFELDESYKAFEVDSRYFNGKNPTWFDQLKLSSMARTYGVNLSDSHPLGYKDGQLLLAFPHNTPDNVPPVYWFDHRSKPWVPVFPRFNKSY